MLYSWKNLPLPRPVYVIVCQDDVDCSCELEMGWNMALLRMPRHVTLDLFLLKMTFQLLWEKMTQSASFFGLGVQLEHTAIQTRDHCCNKIRRHQKSQPYKSTLNRMYIPPKKKSLHSYPYHPCILYVPTFTIKINQM